MTANSQSHLPKPEPYQGGGTAAEEDDLVTIRITTSELTDDGDVGH